MTRHSGNDPTQPSDQGTPGGRDGALPAEFLGAATSYLDLVPAAFIVRDLRDDTILFWNRAAEDLYGWPAATALGQVTHELLRTEFLTPLTTIQEQVAQTGRWRGDLVHYARDGSRLIIDSYWLLQRDPSGNNHAGLELNIDRTEQIRWENERLAALAREASVRDEAERRAVELEAILNSLPDAVYVGTATGITRANQQALDLLGFDSLEDLNAAIPLLAERLQTRHAATGERIAPEDEAFAHALCGERFERDVVVRHLKTGQEVILRSACSPIVWMGDVIGAVAINTDITGRYRELVEQSGRYESEREARLEAEAHALRLREMSQTLSHDLKNPLMSIQGNAQLLLRRLSRESDIRPETLIRSLTSIEATAKRMSTQLNELLDASRLQAGQRLELDRRPVDLVSLVHRLAGEFQVQTSQHQIRLEIDALRLVGVWDGPRLERVIGNLVNNAIKYTPGGGVVSVALAVEGTPPEVWAVLRVQDSGVGIPPGDLDRLFDRFYRGGNVAGQIPGTGLGLSSARQIVEQHGGTITVASTLGAGSTFTLRLPVAR